MYELVEQTISFTWTSKDFGANGKQWEVGDPSAKSRQSQQQEIRNRPPTFAILFLCQHQQLDESLLNMGRELQKKKNRSGLQKVRQKPKTKKRLLQHPIIAANWDKSQTLEQNYKRLGLTVKLNKHTGGVEKKAEDVRRAREEAEGPADARRKNDMLAIATARRPEKLDVQEARIERDPETGKILRVIEPGRAKANPLNDPLAELDSESEAEGMEGFNQHASNSASTATDASSGTEVVQKLEQEARKPTAKHKVKQSGNERAFIAELVEKHGDDYAAMARDMKVNYMQRSEGDLKRRVKKWVESGGSVS